MEKIDFTKPQTIFFIGIGGSSMSGLAKFMLAKGFTVVGSDVAHSYATEALEAQGVTIYYGQKEESISKQPTDYVVYSAAIHPGNPDYDKAVESKVPMLSRAELLGELMQESPNRIAISGTHGKTTTTSMIAKIFLNANLDPTLHIGGVLEDIHSNVRVGDKKYFVSEACEYTNSFLTFYPTCAVVLDIEADHLDFFKDLDDIYHSFRLFLEELPEDGTAIINSEIPGLDTLLKDLKCKVITYGPDDSCDYYPSDISYDTFAHPTFTMHRKDGTSERVTLRVPGEHNVYNAMAAYAVGDLYGIDSKVIDEALYDYQGTHRRFEYKGEFGDGVTVIDDYAHHPTEIEVTLRALQNTPHRTIWAVFQPFTYTRTKDLMDDFAKALALGDRVVLSDIMGGRETDDLGITSEDLQKKILSLGIPCDYVPTFDEIDAFLKENCQKDDVVITMGCGNIGILADQLVK